MRTLVVPTSGQRLSRAPKPRDLQKNRLSCKAVPVTSTPQIQTVELGKSVLNSRPDGAGLKVPEVGVGIWSWGDRSGYWGYGLDYGKQSNKAAFQALMESGLVFLDTAEVYGFGKSEEFLGEFMKESGSSALVATKFAPLPWRFTPESVVLAAKASLARLQVQKMGLYIQHWPGFALQAFSNDAFLEGLIKVKEQGLTEAVGVSNFNASRVRNAARVLGNRGAPLSSNQVQYSLLYRAPETNGVLEACKESDVTLVAYSPLAQGILTGKWKIGGKKPAGPRSAVFTDDRLQQVQPVLQLVEAIAKERGKTMAQVAINWCVCKGVVPIPGAKDAKQVGDIAGAVGWRLSDAEMAELDAVSSRVPSTVGAPFEKW